MTAATLTARIRNLLLNVVGQDLAIAIAGGTSVVVGTVSQSAVEGLIKWSAQKLNKIEEAAEKQVTLDEASKHIVEVVVNVLIVIHERATSLMFEIKDTDDMSDEWSAHDEDFMMMGALL